MAEQGGALPAQGGGGQVGAPVLLIEAWIDTEGGFDSYQEPFYLEQNQCAYLQNLHLDKRGKRTRRAGVQAYGGLNEAGGGVGESRNNAGTRYVHGIWGAGLWTTNLTGGWSALASCVSFTSGELHGIAVGQVLEGGTGYWADFIYHAQSATIPSTTRDPLWIVPDGTTSATLQASFAPRAAVWYQGRLWIGNNHGQDFNYPNRVYWSDILDGVSWDTGRYIEVDPSGGDEIMAIVPARTTTPRLYIFKRNSVWALDMVWGSGVYIPATENDLDTSNSRLSLISEDYGCVAPRTIVYTSSSQQADLFFLARDGLRSLRRVEQDVAGGTSAPLSEPIQDIINRINWGAVDGAVATVHENKIYLSIPVDGSASNNLVLVYDLQTKTWAETHTWTIGDSTRALSYSAAPTLFFQNLSATSDNVFGSGATSVRHIYEIGNSAKYQDPGATDFTYQEQSRGFAFGQYNVDKRWNWVEYLFDAVTTTVSLAVYAKVDNSNWGLLYNGTISPTVTLSVAPSSTAWSAAAQFQRLQLGLLDAPLGRAIQFKLETDTGTDFAVRALRVSAWPYADLWL